MHDGIDVIEHLLRPVIFDQRLGCLAPEARQGTGAIPDMSALPASDDTAIAGTGKVGPGLRLSGIDTIMRLWIFSDLHVEFCPDWHLPAPADFDLIIAAGDIHSPASSGIRWLAEIANGKPVIYVSGNHEWYAVRRDFTVADEGRRAAELAAELGVHWLMDGEVEVDGVRFLGTTLWTDYALYGSVAGAMQLAERGLNDHRYIFPDASMTPLTAQGAQAWHLQSLDWLTEKLSAPSPQPTVVVTHHLPHRGSIDPAYAGSPLNPAFCSDLSPLIEELGPALWVHGHTHASCNYQVGSTRALCNPKGYGPTSTSRKIENLKFNPALVFDLPSAEDLQCRSAG